MTYLFEIYLSNNIINVSFTFLHIHFSTFQTQAFFPQGQPLHLQFLDGHVLHEHFLQPHAHVFLAAALTGFLTTFLVTFFPQAQLLHLQFFDGHVLHEHLVQPQAHVFLTAALTGFFTTFLIAFFAGDLFTVVYLVTLAILIFNYLSYLNLFSLKTL